MHQRHTPAFPGLLGLGSRWRTAWCGGCQQIYCAPAMLADEGWLRARPLSVDFANPSRRARRASKGPVLGSGPRCIARATGHRHVDMLDDGRHPAVAIIEKTPASGNVIIDWSPPPN